jgi:hypothetical protein
VKVEARSRSSPKCGLSWGSTAPPPGTRIGLPSLQKTGSKAVCHQKL